VRDEARIGQHGIAAFHVDEVGGLVEIEIEFLLIEEMKRGDVVPLETEMLDGGLQFRERDEEIGKDDDERTLADVFRGVVQGGQERGAADRFDAGHLLEDEAEMRGAAPDWNLDRFLGEAAQTDGVTLAGGEIAERTRELARVIETRGAGRAVAHRAAGVDQEADAKVGVSLEFLDVKAVTAAPGAPVEAADIVAGNIFAILRKFER